MSLNYFCKMESISRIQILHKAFCLSLDANADEGVNPSPLPMIIGT